VCEVQQPSVNSTVVFEHLLLRQISTPMAIVCVTLQQCLPLLSSFVIRKPLKIPQ